MFVLPVSMKYPDIRNNVTSIRSAPKNGVDRMEVVLLLSPFTAHFFPLHHTEFQTVSIHNLPLFIG